MTMWQVVVLYAVVLFSATLADGQHCDSNTPDNCTFVSGVPSCSWTFHSGWTYDRSSAVFGTGGSSKANTTSTTACSTGMEAHCLQIGYSFEGNNISIRVLLIRVRDEDDRDTCRELVAWNATGSRIGEWQSVSIRIQSNDNFSITVEARQFSQNVGGKIFIKYIYYIKAPCSTVSTSTVPSPLTSTGKERTTTIGSPVSTVASSIVPSPATRTQEERSTTISSQVSTDASNDVGVVVGIVIAVIVIAVAVFIFILYRRKQLHLWKTCFRNENEMETTDKSQNGERKDSKRSVHSVNGTPTVSGYENHPFTLSGLRSSVSYYNPVTHSADGLGDSAPPCYSNSGIHESQSVEGPILSNDSKLADDDPYEIKAENGNLPSAATRNTHPNTHAKGKTRQYQNYLVPASNIDKSQPTSDYSLARATAADTTGVYHYPEEDPRNPGEGGETALYQYAKDLDVNGKGNADGTGIYHILERDSPGSQPISVYHVPKGGKDGQQHTQTVKVSNGQTGNYNTLDFAGKNSGQKNDADASGGVYNHLNVESDDPYNEVNRENRAEVIDGEYSHIK